MNFDYNFYNLVLSEVVARIASDQIIIEKEASDLIVSSDNKKFKNIIRRNRVNILLMSELIFVGRQFSDSPIGTVNLLDAVKLAELAFMDSTLILDKKRTRPFIAVIGDKKIITCLLKIILAIVVLEDTKINKLPISIRRRGDFVTFKVTGGKIANHDLFLKDSATLASNLFVNYGAGLRFAKIKNKRVVFLRLQLSNQMPLLV
ncbi:MAG: hypothetical protein WCP56_01245 [Candidatus Saccharibacteria bacterium]